MQIYIPTLSRPERQTTLEQLPIKWKRKCKLVVDQAEKDLYLKHHPKSLILPVDRKTTNIGQVRQWIIEKASSKYVMMLDDDMIFHERIHPKEIKLQRIKPEAVGRMIDLLEEWLGEGFVHVGISPRRGNNYVLPHTHPIAEITRMNNAYAYNASVLIKEGIRFDATPVMEDFHVTLSLLEAGYPNRVTYQYAWGQRQSGEEGGCSNYRTAEMQKQAAIQLCKLHPESVRLTGKKSKTDWKGVGTTRTDVTIYWQKAFKPKKTEGPGISDHL